MSISRFIDIVKKDRNADNSTNKNNWIGWKAECLDFWILEILFEIKDLYFTMDPKLGEICIIPKEVMEEMATALKERKFEICPEACSYFCNYTTWHGDRLQMFGETVEKFIKKAKDDEEFIYTYGGN